MRDNEKEWERMIKNDRDSERMIENEIEWKEW